MKIFEQLYKDLLNDFGWTTTELVYYKQYDKLLQLIKEEPDLAIVYKSPNLNILDWATYFNEVEIVKILIDLGMDKDKRCQVGLLLESPHELAKRKDLKQILEIFEGQK